MTRSFVSKMSGVVKCALATVVKLTVSFSHCRYTGNPLNFSYEFEKYHGTTDTRVLTCWRDPADNKSDRQGSWLPEQNTTECLV